MTEKFGVLDLFDNDNSKLSKLQFDIAHDDEEKDGDRNEPEIEEKEDTEIEVSQKTKKIKRKDDDDEFDIGKNDIIKIIAWVLAGIGGGTLLYTLLKKHKGDTSEILPAMMVLMYQQQLQQMNKGCNGYHCELPPKEVIDGGKKDKDSVPDWAKWYDENKDKAYPIFGKDKKYILNKLHVAENWKVRRDLHGNIIDVNKTNEYIR
jgi:hypothetical protein